MEQKLRFWQSAPALNLGSTEITCIVLPNDSILCLDSQIMIFQHSVLAISQFKDLCFMSTLLKETKSLKKWVKIVGNYHLVKYNILILILSFMDLKEISFIQIVQFLAKKMNIFIVKKWADKVNIIDFDIFVQWDSWRNG